MNAETYLKILEYVNDPKREKCDQSDILYPPWFNPQLPLYVGVDAIIPDVQKRLAEKYAIGAFPELVFPKRYWDGEKVDDMIRRIERGDESIESFEPMVASEIKEKFPDRVPKNPLEQAGWDMAAAQERKILDTILEETNKTVEARNSASKPVYSSNGTCFEGDIRSPNFGCMLKDNKWFKLMLTEEGRWEWMEPKDSERLLRQQREDEQTNKQEESLKCFGGCFSHNNNTKETVFEIAALPIPIVNKDFSHSLNNTMGIVLSNSEMTAEECSIMREGSPTTGEPISVNSCTCSIQDLMTRGCTCGYIEKERKQ